MFLNLKRACCGALLLGGAATPTEKLTGWTLTGNASQCYEAARDTSVHHSGLSSGRLSFRIDNCAGAGMLVQEIRADEYRSHRVRLGGYVKTREAGRANLVLLIEGRDGRVLALDNMVKRSTRGTKDWHYQSIDLDVPDEAVVISYGALLGVSGELWVDDLELTVVERKGKTGNMVRRPELAGPGRRKLDPKSLPTALVNGGFEK